MTHDSAELLPVEDAIRAIITAPNIHEASRIRNEVAYAAMKKRRPEAEADACRDAYFDRWGHLLANQKTKIGPPITGYWGD